MSRCLPERFFVLVVLALVLAQCLNAIGAFIRVKPDSRQHGAYRLDAVLHRQLGNDGEVGKAQIVRQLLDGAGFSNVIVRIGARRSGDPFTVLVASAVKARRRGTARRARLRT